LAGATPILRETLVALTHLTGKEALAYQARLFRRFSIAVAAQKILAHKGVAARVVSVPCMDLFFEQSEAYQRSVIGDAPIKVGVEAAIRQSWDAIIGDGPFVGMKSYGASGTYKALYEHFGITPQAVADAALARV
jgi:transketolase